MVVPSITGSHFRPPLAPQSILPATIQLSFENTRQMVHCPSVSHFKQWNGLCPLLPICCSKRKMEGAASFHYGLFISNLIALLLTSLLFISTVNQSLPLLRISKNLNDDGREAQPPTNRWKGLRNPSNKHEGRGWAVVPIPKNCMYLY